MWGLKRRQRHHVSDSKSRLNVIFDFDGTIANTLPIVIELVEKWSVASEPLTVEKVEQMRGMTAQQIIKMAGIPLRKIPGLVTKGRKELLHELHRAKPFSGLPEVVARLSKTCNLYVMSSNSSENIEQLLEAYKLRTYFQSVYGGVSLFGKTKMLKQIIVQEGLEKDRCVYIGDETRDIEAAHKIGLKIVSVTWGYNNKQILQQFGPDYLVNQPKDLLSVLE